MTAELRSTQSADQGGVSVVNCEGNRCGSDISTVRDRIDGEIYYARLDEAVGVAGP